MNQVYMIGHGHIDPVWLWRWQEGFSEIKATFRSALDRMKEYPDFIFSQTSALFYEWIETNDPEMFAEIQEAVKLGRWEICGGWLVESDCNLPGGESFVRQALYGQRYFKNKFGKIAKVGMNADSFGHNANLPQILKKSGLDYYVFMRPKPMEKGLPGRLFNWYGIDNSHILTYRIPYEYLTDSDNVTPFMDRIKVEQESENQDLMMFFGVGNHGGGPTKKNIESILNLNNQKDKNYELKMSTMENYFLDQVEKTGNNFKNIYFGDLQHHASGCYSVVSKIKALNRKTENALVASEKFSVLSHALMGTDYPLYDYTEAWKYLLFNSFHDILAGTSIYSSVKDAELGYSYGLLIAQKNTNNALQKISWNIEIPFIENSFPFVVFNPSDDSSKNIIELETPYSNNTDLILKDLKENYSSLQRIQSESVTNRTRYVFTDEIPALGWKTYILSPTQKRQNPIDSKNKCSYDKNNDLWVESKKYKIKFSHLTGYIIELIDKDLGVQFVASQGQKLLVINDESDTWSHDVYQFNDVISEMKLQDMEIVENGNVRTCVRMRYYYDKKYSEGIKPINLGSTVFQYVYVYHVLDEIRIKFVINWNEPCTRLKYSFPVNLQNSHATYSVPYGAISKSSNGEEEPGQAWIDYSGEIIDKHVICGITFANDSKYSYSFDVETMSITLVNNSVFAHHDPAQLNQKDDYFYTDSGRQIVEFAIQTHPGYPLLNGSDCLAERLNQKLTVIPETFHHGHLDSSFCGYSCSSNTVQLCALKRAEDNKGTILRVREVANREESVEINLKFLQRTINTTLERFEIKSFYLPDDINSPVYEVNFLEWKY